MKVRTCVICNTTFEAYTGKTCSRVCFTDLMRKHRTGKKSSEETRKKQSENLPKGEQHHAWKGGKIKNYAGYVMVKDSTNPRKYHREHRKIIEEALGRPLERWEHVHHIDGSKTNNNIDNLMIVTNEQHRKIHRPKTDHKIIEKKGTWFIVECNNCKKVFEVAGYEFRAGHGKYCSNKCYGESMVIS